MDWLLPPRPIRVSIVHTPHRNAPPTSTVVAHSLLSHHRDPAGRDSRSPLRGLAANLQIRTLPPFSIRNFQLPMQYVQESITTCELQFPLSFRMAHHDSRGLCRPSSSGGALQFMKRPSHGLVEVICTNSSFLALAAIIPSLLALLSRQAF